MLSNKNSWNVSYHARREAPILVDQVYEGERDSEEAEEQVGQGQVGDEHVSGGRRHLNIFQHLNIRLKDGILNISLLKY